MFFYMVIPFEKIEAKNHHKKDEIEIIETDNNQEEIITELRELDPTFSYEGELVSANKKTVKIKNTDPSITRGAIGDYYMSIIITVSRINDPGNDTFQINATAQWKSVPAFRMQDAFAISWGRDFALISSKCVASYKSMGITSGKTSKITSTPNAGVGYSVEASHYYGQALDWTRITAKISQINRKGTANVSAAYCHRKASLGDISVSFDKNTTGIGFSVFGLSDTMAADTWFKY